MFPIHVDRSRRLALDGIQLQNLPHTATLCHSLIMCYVPKNRTDRVADSLYSKMFSESEAESFWRSCGRSLWWCAEAGRRSVWWRRSLRCHRSVTERRRFIIIVVISVTTNAVQGLRHGGRLDLTRTLLLGALRGRIRRRRLVDHAVQLLVHRVEDQHRLLDRVRALVWAQHRRDPHGRDQCRLHAAGASDASRVQQLRVLSTEVHQVSFQSLVRLTLKTQVPTMIKHEQLTLWCPLLPYRYRYKAFCVTPYYCRLWDGCCCVYSYPLFVYYFVCVSICVFCVFFVFFGGCFLCSFLLQYFDTVGWVIRPVKTVGCITYIVLVQMLNHAQSINQS